MALSNQNELKAKIDEALQRSGEIDRLKNLLVSRLSECGWKDQVTLECRKIIKERGVDNLDVDALVRDVTPTARELLPGTVKKELLEQIQTAVHQQIEASRKVKHERF